MPLLNYTGKNIFTINAVGTEPVVLMPGVNEISQTSLDACKGHPAFASFVDKEIIIILQEKLVTADGKMSVADMLNIIPKTFDSKLLKKIISTDGRDLVTAAAREQLDFIKNPKRDEKGTEGEHFK